MTITYTEVRGSIRRGIFTKTSACFSPEPNLWAFLIVNGGLVAALVGLTFLRRRLARQAAGATERPADSAAPTSTPEQT